jgi:hypothetical protein
MCQSISGLKRAAGRWNVETFTARLTFMHSTAPNLAVVQPDVQYVTSSNDGLGLSPRVTDGGYRNTVHRREHRSPAFPDSSVNPPGPWQSLRRQDSTARG